ncbi:hypothetical protein X777_13984, partial [Ooceraea biroi]
YIKGKTGSFNFIRKAPITEGLTPRLNYELLQRVYQLLLQLARQDLTAGVTLKERNKGEESQPLVRDVYLAVTTELPVFFHVRNIAVFVSLADIFVLEPCNAGKKLECSKAGFGKPSLGATSLVMRKQCTLASLKMKGNDPEMAGAACVGGNAIFPIGSLSPNPKMPFT